ncbi:hypothetical protein AMELA_G00220140 [Ameiurus melas]|uniref:Uncharacterized protein n=1 Tax=Ameiurus melas TaxID=219545 RepID=A0A7J6A294_AMEME|nr:hypothetical protein AMELA_G00220140 [Ameiurus melas]
MLWWTLLGLRLAVTVLCLSSRSVAEQQLLCSSKSLTIWWEYDGPLHYFSISTGPCTNGMDVLYVNYTLITKFTIARAGYVINSYYKNQLWVEFFQPPVPCEDLNICHVIKGETLRESLAVSIKPYSAAEGEYRFDVHLNIIDDLEREITITLNVTAHVRNGDG